MFLKLKSLGDNKSKEGLRTTIRARMLRLGIISVLVSCTVLSVFAVLDAGTIVDTALEHSCNNSAIVVESCYTMLETDMQDLAQELATSSDLCVAITDGNNALLTEVVPQLCTDSWIKGVKVTDSAGQVLYKDGWAINETGYGVSDFDRLTYTSKAACDNGYLWLICDIVESSALSAIVENHGVEYAAYSNNKLIYTTLDGVSETYAEGTNVKINGQIYDESILKFAENDGIDFIVYENKTPYIRSENTMLLIMLLLSVFLVSLEIIIACNVAKVIAKSITVVVDRLKQLVSGDLQTPAPNVTRGDETEVLAKELGVMLTTLNNTINDIKAFVKEVSIGNLTYKSTVQYAGDYKQVGESLETLRTALVKLVGDAQQASTQVSTGASQVATGATQLSQTTVEEAAEMERLSVHLDEVGNASTQNAELARNAAKIVNEMQDVVQKGTESMDTLQGAMTDIVEATKKIENINKTIDDIAFQTNILALNAAVEAARAGSAGKGFAVVADEVRNLASKSAEAVKTTSQLIQQAVQAVQQGTELTSVSANNYKQTSDKMNEVTTLVNEVVNLTQKQTDEISEMNNGFENITKAIQNAAAVAEESAASAEEMSAQADILTKSLENYTVDDV